MNKYPSLIRQRYLLSKEEKCRTSSQMSSFITEQILNGEQLTDETTNLALKIIKNQYSSWNCFEDTTLRPI